MGSVRRVAGAAFSGSSRRPFSSLAYLRVLKTHACLGNNICGGVDNSVRALTL